MSKPIKVEIVSDKTKPKWQLEEAKDSKKPPKTYGNIRVNDKIVKGKIDYNAINTDKTFEFRVKAKLTELRPDWQNKDITNLEFEIVKVDFEGGKKDKKDRDLTNLLTKKKK